MRSCPLGIRSPKHYRENGICLCYESSGDQENKQIKKPQDTEREREREREKKKNRVEYLVSR